MGVFLAGFLVFLGEDTTIGATRSKNNLSARKHKKKIKKTEEEYKNMNSSAKTKQKMNAAFNSEHRLRFPAGVSHPHAVGSTYTSCDVRGGQGVIVPIVAVQRAAAES